MKTAFFILTLLLVAPACNKTDDVEPQLQEDIHEMKKEKQKDPRHFDIDQEKDLDRREVKREPTSTQPAVDPDKIIWTPANQ